MSDDDTREKRSTLPFHSPTSTEGQIDTLRGVIPADWQPVDEGDTRVLEADLGEGLRLRVEGGDGSWIGTLVVEEFDQRVRTEQCDSHSTVALHLRERLASYGERLKEQGERILEVVQSGD